MTAAPIDLTAAEPGRATGARRAPRLLGRTWYLLERNALVYRRTWLVILSGFFEPVFYLLSVWVGIGRLVGELTLPDGRVVPYTAFVAPGLLAASAMNGSLSESTFRLFRRIVDGRTYQGVLGTPVAVADVALGEVLWAIVRGAVYAAGFLVMAAGVGTLRTWWLLAVYPATLLVCLAFAALGVAWTSAMRSWQDLGLVALAMIPLFLCSGTFFPVSAYPAWGRVLVQATPLVHGVELLRDLSEGNLHIGLLGHVAYLVAMAALFLTLARRRLVRRLVP